MGKLTEVTAPIGYCLISIQYTDRGCELDSVFVTGPDQSSYPRGFALSIRREHFEGRSLNMAEHGHIGVSCHGMHGKTMEVDSIYALL